MKLKPVNVDLDIEGNTVVSDIPQDKTQTDEGSNESNTTEEDTADGNADGENDDKSESDGHGNESEANQDIPNSESGEDGADDGADDGAHDVADDGAEEEEEESSDDAVEEEQEEEQEVVDYDELPEAVQKYLDFHEETGRSIEDFIKAQTKWDDKSQDAVIREYYQRQNPNLDPEDIDFDLKDSFGFDEDLDDESAIRRKKIAKKKFYNEALKQLNAENEKYGTVLESSTTVPQSAKDAIAFKEQFEATQAAQSKDTAARRDYFVKETNKVLSKDFKGFEIDLGEGKNATYKPENLDKTKEENLNVNNLLSKFTDKNGNITDVEGYHLALTFASNPAAVAKHFYEMGQADNADEGARKAKNIDMSTRQVNQPRKTGGFKVKAVEVKEGGQVKTSKPIIKLRNY